MDTPKDLRYTQNHEWIKLEGDTAVVGITDYAQNSLGDIVFIELPKNNDKVEAGKSIAVVESVKSVSDIFAPLDGEVFEVNDELEESPEKVNKDPYGSGWIYKQTVSNSKQFEKLLDSQGYSQVLGTK